MIAGPVGLGMSVNKFNADAMPVPFQGNDVLVLSRGSSQQRRVCVNLIFTLSGSNATFITLKPLRLRCLTGAACAVFKKISFGFFPIPPSA